MESQRRHQIPRALTDGAARKADGTSFDQKIGLTEFMDRWGHARVPHAIVYGRVDPECPWRKAPWRKTD